MSTLRQKIARWFGSSNHALGADEVRRRRRDAIVIAVAAVLFVCVALIELRAPEVAPTGSRSGNLLFFLLINFNVILLVLLVFLVTRNLVKLIFERRRGILGSRLRTRLVVAFVALSLVPTALLFLVAQGFLSAAMESLFGRQVDRSLAASLRIARGLYQMTGNDALHDARELVRQIQSGDLLVPDRSAELQRFIDEQQAALNVAGIEVYRGSQPVAAARSASTTERSIPVVAADLDGALTGGNEFARTLRLGRDELIRSGVPLRAADGTISGVVIVDALVPRSIGRAAQAVARSYQEFRQLGIFRQPIQSGYTLSFLLITLVVIFSATWFGFRLAKGITEPIQRLGEGMREVAQGNWGFRAEPEGDEEIATLFASFNQMTADLTAIHLALEERRRYIENILENIAAGVVSVDARGCIATVNPAAASMLGIEGGAVRGRPWRDEFDRPDLHAVGEVIGQVGTGGAQKVERQIKLRSNGREVTVWATVTVLTDEAGAPAGAMLFLEDVTYLLRVERMEAWREVARRIAHEIKNPLTPIQLSAQRLRKGYAPNAPPRDRELLDECTRTIVGQVEQLKRLVNEFSTFARLPAAEFAPDDLNNVVEEALILFREGHRDIAFEFRPDPALPLLELDRDAIKRAVLNLLDNAVAACQSQPIGEARIELATSYDPQLAMVRLEVADQGTGMTPDVKARAFEPYFSTKRDGTGLGLAIVSAIAADHHAYVRIRDNVPRGTRLIIEFPLRGAATQSTAARA